MDFLLRLSRLPFLLRKGFRQKLNLAQVLFLHLQPKV